MRTHVLRFPMTCALTYTVVMAIVSNAYANPPERGVASAVYTAEEGDWQPAYVPCTWQEAGDATFEAAPGAYAECDSMRCAPQPVCQKCSGHTGHRGCGASCCQCEDCGPSPSCCCGPCWTFRAAAVFLLRNDPPSRGFITQPSGADAFNFNQFGFDPQPGADASLNLDLGSCRSIEARFLGVWNVDDRVAVGPFPPGGVSFNTSPPTPAFFNGNATTITADYISSLQSGEISYKVRTQSYLTLSTGLRYVNLRERFNGVIEQTNVLGASVIDIANSLVDNHLAGVQVAADIDLFVDARGRYRVSGFGKTGVYYAHSQHTLNFTQIDGTPGGLAGGNFTRRGSPSADGVAFVAEAGLQFSYQITRRWALQIGYQVLWLQDVAVASDQISASGNIFNPQTSARIDANGAVLYHGATGGLEFRF